MALGYSILGRGSIGDIGVRVVDITMDNAYVAGGWALTAQGLGFGASGTVLAVLPVSSVEQGRLIEYDQVNQKLMVRDASGAANAASPEISTLTQMAGFVLRVLALGRGVG